MVLILAITDVLVVHFIATYLNIQHYLQKYVLFNLISDHGLRK